MSGLWKGKTQWASNSEAHRNNQFKGCMQDFMTCLWHIKLKELWASLNVNANVFILKRGFLKRTKWRRVKRLISKVERGSDLGGRPLRALNILFITNTKRADILPATFSSFIKQSSYTFIIVQILSFIGNSDWPVTSKGIQGDLVQVRTVPTLLAAAS